MSINNLPLFLFVVFLNSCTSCEPSVSSSIASYIPEYTCTTSLSMCGLETGKYHFTSAKGLKGDDGKSGIDGLPGKDGLPGMDGLKGSDSKDGKGGPPGLSGAKGLTGPQGPPGVRGAKREQGSPGPPGSKGPRGEMGPPGTPGSCYYEYEDPGVVHDDTELEWGTEEFPANVTCRNAPASEHAKKIGTYFLCLGPTEVICDFETNRTCVSHKSSKPVTYTESKPFWLSQRGISMKELYNLESDQLTWLQRKSYTANLTIRYHCKNSIPVGKTAITLLSWNDMKIGPKSSSSTLLHYDVLNDGCSTVEKDKWSFTDIVLLSPSAQILPVTDFLINDVRNEDQEIRIEIKQLCFN